MKSRSLSNDYDRANRRRREVSTRDERLAEGIAIDLATRAAKNATDRQWLEALLSLEGLYEGSTRLLRGSLEWLRGNPTSALPEPIRARYRSLERAMRMVAEGVEVRSDKRKPRRGMPRKPKPNRPAWMDDPSLLPKRPPRAA